jgi:hypothetical protein
MATVKFAEFAGHCPLCSCPFPKQARIARTPYGWGHETCVAEWKGARERARLVGSAASQ